jgi:cytochrome c-type biogenesis protein CcmH/NrfG
MGGQYRKQAEAAFQRAISLAPSSTEYLLELAVLYRSAGREEKARELIRKALVIDKDDPNALAALESFQKPKKRFFGLAFWEKER